MLRLFHPDEAAELRTVPAHGGAILGMALDARGVRLATTGRDSTVKVWSVPELVLAATMQGNARAAQDVEFSPGGDLLTSCGDDGTIRFWEPHTGDEIARLAASSTPMADIAFDSSGRRLAAVSQAGEVQIWDVAGDRSLLATVDEHSRLTAVAWSRDGTRIVTGGADGIIRLHDTSLRGIVNLHGRHRLCTTTRDVRTSLPAVPRLRPHRSRPRTGRTAPAPRGGP